MLKTIHTVLEASLSAPVRLLHITDVHVTPVCEQDTSWQQEQMKMRTVTFWKEGGEPAYTPEEFFGAGVGAGGISGCGAGIDR